MHGFARHAAGIGHLVNHSTEQRAELRASLLVFACGMIAYATAVAGVFVYDDLHSVRDNEAIRSLVNVPRFFWDADAFSAIDVRMYRPIVLTTLAFDHAISGLAPWMFKLTNILLHAGCAVLLFSTARAMGCQRARQMRSFWPAPASHSLAVMASSSALP